MTPHGTYDIAVLGLGGVGSTAAWRAAVRGARTIGIEQFGEAHSRGSSHGGSRIFRQTLFEGSAYVPLVKRARGLWQELAALASVQLFQRTGGLCIGPRDSAHIRQAVKSAVEGGFEHHLLEPDEFVARYPQHAAVEGDVAVFEPGAGVLNPERCVSAALAMARAHGADIRLRSRVTGIHHDADEVHIDIGNGQHLQEHR